MAKIAFSKLKCKQNVDTVLCDFNNEQIEIKQYLPIQDKLGMLSKIITMAYESDTEYANPVKLQVYTELEIIMNYTNITFTEKQQEDIPKLYDIVNSSGLKDIVFQNIPQKELTLITEGIEKSVQAIYNYHNSTVGIMQALTAKYENLNIEALKSQNTLEALTQNSVLSDIVALLGQE